jgi:hypothetical protein
MLESLKICIIFFFFLKKRKIIKHMGILKILIGFNEKFYRIIEIKKKKLKDRYHKLTFFKVCVLFFKIDERSEVISEIFLNY